MKKTFVFFAYFTSSACIQLPGTSVPHFHKSYVTRFHWGTSIPRSCGNFLAMPLSDTEQAAVKNNLKNMIETPELLQKHN